jgi:hypothetical protein
MNILLIEDMAGLAIPMEKELQALGHTVTWIVGAKTVDTDFIVGIRASEALEGLNDDHWTEVEVDRLVTIDLATIDVALIDGGLIKPISSGADYARAVSAFGIPCVSITGGGAGAGFMSDAGCCAALCKEFVLLALKAKVLDFDQLRADPQAAAQSMLSFNEQTRAAHRASSTQKLAFVTGFEVLDHLSPAAAR